jgi:prepilin-type processing-associated H-X9-DG protein
MDMPNPGYQLVNNVTTANNNPYFAISYGINADVTCLVDGNGIGRFDLSSSDSVDVTGGPAPLQCQIDRIAYPTNTLLFADCGTRPGNDSGPPLNWNDTLYYTTNGLSGVLTGTNAYQAYTLQGVNSQGYMNGRISLSRHAGKINVAFADGHAATVPVGAFNTVRVSPYR